MSINIRPVVEKFSLVAFFVVAALLFLVFLVFKCLTYVYRFMKIVDVTSYTYVVQYLSDILEIVVQLLVLLLCVIFFVLSILGLVVVRKQERKVKDAGLIRLIFLAGVILVTQGGRLSVGRAFCLIFFQGFKFCVFAMQSKGLIGVYAWYLPEWFRYFLGHLAQLLQSLSILALVLGGAMSSRSTHSNLGPEDEELTSFEKPLLDKKVPKMYADI